MEYTLLPLIPLVKGGEEGSTKINLARPTGVALYRHRFSHGRAPKTKGTTSSTAWQTGIAGARDELLYLVFLYSIADLSLREITGVCAGSGKRIGDEAVRQRLAACPKWVEGLLGKLLPASTLPQRAEGSWRLVLCDGSQISGSGAKGTDYRKAILDMPDPTTRFGVRDRTMLHLSITAGLRVSELVGLRLDDVTFERHRCQARPESDHP